MQEALLQRGVFGPVRVLGVREAAAALAAFEAELSAHRAWFPAQPPQLGGWHGWVPWVRALATAPALVALIEDALGAPCSPWASEFWVKAPHSRLSVPWHQDDVFWPSPEMKTVSAWIALTEASSSNGGLALVPGSHHKRWEHAPIDNRQGGFDRGIPSQAIPPEDIWMPTLSPGEALVFDERIVHSSPANPSERPRVALSLRFTRAPSPGASAGTGARPPPTLQGTGT